MVKVRVGKDCSVEEGVIIDGCGRVVVLSRGRLRDDTDCAH